MKENHVKILLVDQSFNMTNFSKSFRSYSETFFSISSFQLFWIRKRLCILLSVNTSPQNSQMGTSQEIELANLSSLASQCSNRRVLSSNKHVVKMLCLDLLYPARKRILIPEDPEKSSWMT